MFIGEYHHVLDGKGRLAFPSKFRSALKRGVVVTKGLDGCLFVFSAEEWRKLAMKLSAMPLAQSDSRAFARLMLAGAMEVEFDGQGRALLPEYLRRYAGLAKDAVVAGLFNRLEIWDRKRWEKYRSGMEKDSNEIAERLRELGV